MHAPVEPWADSLKLLMMIFGVLLIAGFVAPWSAADKMIFSWSALTADGPAFMKVVPLMLVATGALALVLGLLPLATIGRGLAAALLGAAPIVYLNVGGGGVTWQAIVGLLGTLTLVSGLLIRSEYRGAMLGRLMVTVGAICVLLPVLIPVGGQVPLVGMFKMIGAAPGKGKVLAILPLIPVALAVASLLAWLPSPSSAGALVIAWIFILWAIIAAILTLVIGGNIGDVLKADLAGTLWMPLATVAWVGLTGYGIATIAGKSLEHS
jgi:hypothetical protein